MLFSDVNYSNMQSTRVRRTN